MIKSVAYFPALLAVLLYGCAPSGDDRPGGEEGVEQTLREIIAADNRSDVETIAGLYAEDAVLIPPGGQPVRGRQAIGKRYRDGFAQFSIEVAFESLETVVAGAWAYNRGNTTGDLIWHDGRPPTPINDNYLMILKRTPEGRWLIFRLIWNGAGTGQP